MLDGTCAYCAAKTHFTARAGYVRTSDPNPDPARYSRVMQVEIVATCDNCKRFNNALGTSLDGGEYEKGKILDRSQAIAVGDTLGDLTWSPPAMITADTDFIPAGVAGFLQEAHDAYSIGAYRAVLLLVRSTVEATAKSKGVTRGDLVKKIDALADQGLIRTGTRDMAHVLRILGNDMAHGDIDETPNEEDARDSLTLARFVLDDVFVADARRVDMLSRRKPK